ncbi:hypothetical protein J4211_00230 [Candidatus Woesearchaeota archaeon]|nr:hypothetical protein [Candidatus Woesearchaeota archaeon]
MNTISYNVPELIAQKKVKLLKKQYIVYLKEVPTRIAPGGKILKITVRAFIKEIK